MRALLFTTFFAAATITTHAQIEPDFPRFTLAQGHTNDQALPISGATLCVLPARSPCFIMPSGADPDKPANKDFYQFGLDPRAERLPFNIDAGSWVFFASTFSGGGSGSLDRLAILAWDPAHRVITNLLPYVAVSNVSDRAVWNLPDDSPRPILVTADFVWDFKAGESHFSPHHFTVEAWRFNFTTHRYARILTYVTQRKYDGGDSASVRVLTPERPEILRRLKTID